MKREKIIYILMPILLAVACIVAYFMVSGFRTDSIKFKKEYESYNNKEIYKNINYIKLDISYNNPIKYSSYDEIFSILKGKTGIIFLGSPKIQDSRNIVNSLFKAAKENKIDKIYYLDVTNDMESFVIEDNEVVYEIDSHGNELKGTEEYHKLVELLDLYAVNYTIEYEGIAYNVLNKKIYIPTVLFVKNGNIIGVHMSTVESHTNMNEALTNEEKEELYNIFSDYIVSMQSSACDVDSAC